MKLLALDSATAACTVALQIEGECVLRHQLAPRQHASLILPMIESLLAEAGITLSQLDAIAFGQGPGSFMGVRIATGIVQGLAFGVDCPVIGVSTLKIIAQTAYEKWAVDSAIPAWDARMQEIYWGAYRLSENKIMTAIQADRLTAPSDIDWPEPENKWSAVGNAWEVYREQLQDSLSSCEKIYVDCYPNASALVKIAAIEYAAGRVQSPMTTEPVYLRNQVAKPK